MNRTRWWWVFGGLLIVSWHGTMAYGQCDTWMPLGVGTNSTVNTVLAYNNELIAGGMFTTAGGQAVNNIARWNGSTWQLLGSGVNSTVNAMVIYNGDLIVAGVFT